MPNIQVKLRRGTTAQHAGFTGAEGEVTVDTDKETLVVHDNATAGGHELLKGDNANLAVGGSEVVVNEGGNDVDFRVEGDSNTNLINTDAANDAVGVGIAAESGYALKSSKIKIEGTAAQLWMKDSDQSTGSSGYEANLALNTGALRVGFTDETVPSMTLYPDGVLGLPSLSVTEANAITAARGAVNGSIISVSNGDAGSPCLAVYDEGSSSWLRIALGSAISAT